MRCRSAVRAIYFDDLIGGFNDATDIPARHLPADGAAHPEFFQHALRAHVPDVGGRQRPAHIVLPLPRRPRLPPAITPPPGGADLLSSAIAEFAGGGNEVL